MFGDLFYRLGSAAGALDARLSGNAGADTVRAAREVAVYDSDTGDSPDLDPDPDDEGAGHSIAIAFGAWLLSRLLRPKPVSLPRVVTAGITATFLADLVGRSTDDREYEPGEAPYAESFDDLLTRMAAGIGIAAGYAAVVYPRIPGPPLLRGLAFGGLETLAAPRGGLVRLADAAPGVKFPLQTLALPIDEDAGPLAHLAFGVGLGLCYRYGDDPDDEE